MPRLARRASAAVSSPFRRLDPTKLPADATPEQIAERHRQFRKSEKAERQVKKEAAAREKAERQTRETLASTLLRLHSNRGLAMSDEARKRIESCRDLRQLEQWIDQAFSVDHVDDLF